MDRKAYIWEETDVIGVMPGIYNDTISVSKNSEIMDDDLKQALQQAFINISETEEGKEVIAIYSHEGYKEAVDADYDNERKAQEIVQQLGNNQINRKMRILEFLIFSNSLLKFKTNEGHLH